jgi:hypothetical protein
MILRHLATVATFSGNGATFSGVVTYNGATASMSLALLGDNEFDFQLVSY